MAGFERLYKDGKLAIVHGCGYDNPSFSHFTSMAYWHTAAPNSGEEYGWVGRLADAMAPNATPNFLVNIAARQSLAVRSRKHVPVVFDDPNKFTQEKFFDERDILGAAPDSPKVENPSRRFLLETAQSAKDASVAGAGSVGEIQIAGGLRNHRARSAQGGGAHRRRHAHAAVLHVVSQQRVRYARVPERRAQTAADVRFRCRVGVHDRPGADRPRGRRSRDDVLRIRTPRSGERQSRHGPRRSQPDVRRRQEREGRPIRHGAEPDQARCGRQSDSHHRFPAESTRR